MTTQTFVLLDGRELSLEETIIHLLNVNSEIKNKLISQQHVIDHLIIRLNEHTQEHV